MPARKRLILPIVVVAAAVAAAVVWWRAPRRASDVLQLYGNVDVRQMQLAFNDAGRVDALLVNEGERVAAGQALARLDAVRYRDAAARAGASLAAAQAVLARLRAGSRPQEVAEAAAAVDAAGATAHNAQLSWQRQRELVAADFLPRQALDDAAAARRAAAAELDRARQRLSLARQGPRREDIAAAAAQVDADRAALALAQRELADTVLRAPAAGVVEDRIVEVGDMASPQVPVYTVALDDPVWARVYLPETELGHVRPGMRAQISSDSFPGKAFAGWIGFVSPTAEFTPKSVQTPELRSELVYRVRVFACNPRGLLRLGMPVTVRVPLHGNAPQAQPERVCGG
jgi:HlyD family secretion protein